MLERHKHWSRSLSCLSQCGCMLSEKPGNHQSPFKVGRGSEGVPGNQSEGLHKGPYTCKVSGRSLNFPEIRSNIPYGDKGQQQHFDQGKSVFFAFPARMMLLALTTLPKFVDLSLQSSSLRTVRLGSRETDKLRKTAGKSLRTPQFVRCLYKRTITIRCEDLSSRFFENPDIHVPSGRQTVPR